MTPTAGNNDFIPLIFAADINAYSLARGFHEQYGITSLGHGKAASGPIRFSRVIDYQPVERADQPDVLPGLITRLAEQHPDRKILVLGCGDNYVREISLAAQGYPPNVVAPYMDYEQTRRLANKQLFYELCDQAGIEHPQTFIYSQEQADRLDLAFGPPFVVKPANTVAWWEHSFPGQRKVHLEPSLDGLKALLSTIYAHGYADAMIIQEYIPGGDSQLFVLTQYFDSQGALRLSCGGRVLLEEHTALGIGNSAVIMSQDLPELASRLAGLLQAQGYKGFAAFDIKLDARDGVYKVLEVNTRQGRGHYYVTGSGLNVTRFVTEDLVYGRTPPPELSARQRYLWYVTPRSVARSCAVQAGLGDIADELLRSGQAGNPLD
ncbi:MAG: ATP-grasp domain-containing protein, partial [Coriobacteriia bacterium]|nr:ATP-grasp domain-containing protein [Coriobacteriia bacterium]